MDYDVDIKPIAKNQEHFNKWVEVYPFYSNVASEGVSYLTQHNEKGTRRDLVLYRLEVAKSDIKSAKILLDAGECRGANNRAYYGIYHAISAIHALDETHIRGIRMPLQILIKIISRQKSSQEFWEGKLLRLKKYDMPAIMMTSI